jgi:hypothetical protein
MTIPQASEGAEPFRACGMCGRQWMTREELIADPELRLLGLQAIVDLPESNLVVFEHSCGTSVSVLATRLRDLLTDEPEGQEPLPLLFESPACGGHCGKLDDLEACEQPCSNARDRRLVIWIASQPGRKLGSAIR